MLNVIPSAEEQLITFAAILFFALSATIIMKGFLSGIGQAPEAIGSSQGKLFVGTDVLRAESLEFYLKDMGQPLEASYESELDDIEEACAFVFEQQWQLDAHIRLRHILETSRPGGGVPAWKLEDAAFDADFENKLADAVHGLQFTVPSDSDVLSCAVERGNWQALGFLLINGAMESTELVHRAMHKAASLGMTKCMDKLVTAAVQTGIPAVVDGDALLTLAVKSGNHRLVQYMLQLPVFSPRFNNDEALMAASTSTVEGNAQVLQVMMSRVDPRVQSNKALLSAIDANLPALVRVLLDDPRVHPSCRGNEPMFRYLSKPHLDRLIFCHLYFHKDFNPALSDYAILRKLAINDVKHWKAPEVMAHPRANIKICLKVLERYKTDAALDLAEIAKTVIYRQIVPEDHDQTNFYLNYYCWRNDHAKVRYFLKLVKPWIKNQHHIRRAYRLLLLISTGHWEVMAELRDEFDVMTARHKEYALANALHCAYIPVVEILWQQILENDEIAKFIDIYRRLEFNLHWMKDADTQIQLMQENIRVFQKKYYEKMPVHQLLLEIAMKHFTAMFTMAAQLKPPLLKDVSDAILKSSWATYGSPLNRDTRYAAFLPKP